MLVGSSLRMDAPPTTNAQAVPICHPHAIALGSIVQDLSSAWRLYELARAEGFGADVDF